MPTYDLCVRCTLGIRRWTLYCAAQSASGHTLDHSRSRFGSEENLGQYSFCRHAVAEFAVISPDLRETAIFALPAFRLASLHPLLSWR